MKCQHTAVSPAMAAGEPCGTWQKPGKVPWNTYKFGFATCHPKIGTQVRPQGLCGPRPTQAHVCADVQWTAGRNMVKKYNLFPNLFKYCLPLNSCKPKTDGRNLVGAEARLLHPGHLVQWMLWWVHGEHSCSQMKQKPPQDQWDTLLLKGQRGGLTHEGMSVWLLSFSPSEMLQDQEMKLCYILSFITINSWTDSELPSMSEWAPQAAAVQFELPVVSDICVGTAKQDCHFAVKKSNISLYGQESFTLT